MLTITVNLEELSFYFNTVNFWSRIDNRMTCFVDNHQSHETELDKPKENMQPERRDDKPNEVHRAKRHKTSTFSIPATKQNVTYDRPQVPPRVNADAYQDGQYIATCEPSANFPSQERYQATPTNSSSRQFVHPTPLSMTVTSAYPTVQSRSSLQPLSLPELEPARDMGNVPEMNTFQGDFISAIDKAFFSAKVTLNPNEYMGASWVQNETSNLTVLNPVNVQEHNSENNTTMGFPGNGNYPVSYDNSVPLNVYSNAHSMPSNPRQQEIPYISPTKDDFGYIPSITNMYSRYNAPNYLYDPIRSVVQSGGTDVMPFNGLLNSPSSSFGMDVITPHDAQMNRLGIGAV